MEVIDQLHAPSVLLPASREQETECCLVAVPLHLYVIKQLVVFVHVLRVFGCKLNI
jgi:hypothetical protein